MRHLAILMLVALGLTVPAAEPTSKEENSRAQALEAKLKALVFPKVEFEAVSLREAVQVLRQKSKELDPDGEGINFVVHTSDENPKLTLSLNNVSLRAILRTITLLTDTEYEVVENIVIIKLKSETGPKSKPAEPAPAR